MKLKNSFLSFVFDRGNLFILGVFIVIGIFNGQLDLINFWSSIFIACIMSEYLYVMNNVRMTRGRINRDILKGAVVLGVGSGILMWFLLNTRGANIELNNGINFINGLLYNVFFALGGAWTGIFMTEAMENKGRMALGMVGIVIVFLGGVVVGSLIYTDFEYSVLFYGEGIVEYMGYIRIILLFILTGMVIFLKNNIEKRIFKIQWC